jgi:catechol 2,3-dioxygenase-like lactoylglutathione lyase family enzyme
MAGPRMDNMGIVVSDIDAAVAFFSEIGLELEGRGTFSGPWMDRTIDLEHAECEIAMLRTPDGSGRLELSHPRLPAGHVRSRRHR